MFRKLLPVLLFVVSLAAPAVAAERERPAGDRRMRDEPVAMRILRLIKKIVTNGDGITIPKP